MHPHASCMVHFLSHYTGKWWPIYHGAFLCICVGIYKCTRQARSTKEYDESPERQAHSPWLDLSWSWTHQPRSSAVARHTTWTWGSHEGTHVKIVKLSLTGTYSCKVILKLAISNWQPRVHEPFLRLLYFKCYCTEYNDSKRKTRLPWDRCIGCHSTNRGVTIAQQDWLHIGIGALVSQAARCT